MGTALPPLEKPPPYIQTSTGLFSVDEFAPVHTFRYKQSSLIGSLGIKNSALHMLKGAGDACIGLGPNVSHFFTPVHGAASCGAFHLSSPTGGAAKGTPLKM